MILKLNHILNRCQRWMKWLVIWTKLTGFNAAIHVSPELKPHVQESMKYFSQVIILFSFYFSSLNLPFNYCFLNTIVLYNISYPSCLPFSVSLLNAFDFLQDLRSLIMQPSFPKKKQGHQIVNLVNAIIVAFSADLIGKWQNVG